MDKVKEKVIALNDALFRDGFTGETGVWNTLFSNKDKLQIISEENLIKELSFDEAKEQVEDFKRCVVESGQCLNDYFTGTRAGNTVLKDYVTNTEEQNISTQGLIRATKNARAEQIKNNETAMQSTLAYKAQSVAIKGVAMVGNMLLGMAIGVGINLIANAIINYANAVDNAVEESKNALSETQSSLQNVNQELEHFNRTVHDIVWRDIIDFRNGSNIKVYLKDKDYYIIGHYKLSEIESNDPWFVLSGYGKYDIKENKPINKVYHDNNNVYITFRLSDVDYMEIF